MSSEKLLSDYKRELEKALFSLPVAYYQSGNREIVIRCPFCGDSNKNHNRGHLYVKMDFGKGDIACFYCQKCKTRGFISEEFLRDINADVGTNLTVLQKMLNVKNYNNFKNSKFKLNNCDIKLLPPLNNQNTKIKMNYIEERLGISITVKDLLKYKIVLNFYDFLMYNDIKKVTRDKRITDKLDRQYIGFISSDNNYIVMRNIGEIDDYAKRYINYNIHNAYDNTKKFYIIKNSVNVMHNVDFILTEGVMDIIGVHNHIYDRDDTDKIYAAACGGGFENLIRYLIRCGFIFSNIHIYSDKDMDLSFYKNIKRNLGKKFKGKFVVYYNSKFKDYGTTKDNIKVNSFKI